MARIDRKDWKLFGNVLKDTVNFWTEGGTVSKNAVDPGTDQEGALRPGLVLGKSNADGLLYPYGVNFKNGTTTATGDGSTTTFELAHQHLVPFSETVRVGTTTLVRDVDYKIDYKRGVVEIFEAPANGSSISITYLYDDVLDGTEIPVGILMDYVYIDSGQGPEDVDVVYVVAGHVYENQIKVVKEASLAFAIHVLSRNFFGINDPALAL